MNQTTLQKLTTAGSAMGIIILIIYAILVNIEQPAPDQHVPVDTSVHFSGTISSITQHQQLTFIDMKTTCTIPLVVFSPIHFKENDTINVIAIKQRYQGKDQWVAERIST